ncbi:hypothetical protein WJX74_001901 [Apatococcus lobatus]|uniref:LysM domain-containing protein n=1 Tax=Apatococcus lobatus TaxID=904363 RepID=A0AAW1RE77_9CHLO
MPRVKGGCRTCLLCSGIILLAARVDAQPPTSEFVGPPCTSGCLFAVQGSLTLRDIASTAETSFTELVSLNDAKYVSGEPGQVYQQPTICVSADYCTNQNLKVSLGIGGTRNCDSNCLLISQPDYNITFAKVAEEASSAIINRNSQAQAIAPYDLLALNPASKYAGPSQTTRHKKQRRTLGSYNKAKKAHNKRQQVHLKQMRTIQQLRELYYAPDQARCMDLLPSEDGPDDEEGPNEEGEAGQQEEDGNVPDLTGNSTTSAELVQRQDRLNWSTSLIMQDFIAQSNGVHDSMGFLRLHVLPTQPADQGWSALFPSNLQQMLLAKSLPFQQEPDQHYDGGGLPEFSDDGSTFDSLLDFLNSGAAGSGELKPFLPRYAGGDVDAVLPFQSLCLPTTYCRRCTQIQRVAVGRADATASSPSRGSAEPSVPAIPV